MNKYISMGFLLTAFATLFAFTACSEDNGDNEPIIDPVYDWATTATGTYNGTMNTLINIMGSDKDFGDTENQEIIISRDSINHVTVTYKNWTGMGTNYGDLIFSPVRLSSTSEGIITLSGTCRQTLYKDERSFEAMLAINGNISGTAKNIQLNIEVEMPKPAPSFKLTYRGKPEDSRQ